ncbi:unnamed protein product [Adineta steineri]|uniref:Secreted protein n=3 Tax=Adineta steineri TaxID=433720 RepID=A0A815W734_9BILA|nr:unnamed protein product [Adineta steineri]
MCCCTPLILVACCLACNCKRGVPVTLWGPHGLEVFTFDRAVVLSALGDIPRAALPHKIATQPSRSTGPMHPQPYPPTTQQYPPPIAAPVHKKYDYGSAF